MATEGRIQEHNTHHRGRGATLGACLVAALGLTLAMSPVARAADGVAQPRIEVAPGVYLGSASELATASHDPPGPSSTDSTSVPKIVGGNTSDIRRWPWQVSIGYLPISPNNPYRNHTCGGSLVAPTIVVTAAHCMTLGTNVDFKPASDFQVISGRTRLSSSAGQVHNLADYYWFVDQNGKPLWDPNTAAWDAVFLRLASPASQKTIKIAGPDEANVWMPGRRAFITGWGTTREGMERGTDVLRQASIRMIADSSCDSVYGALLVPAVMVCAGEEAGGVDACAGDSGGPLVVPIADRRYRLIGDTSFSAAGCGQPGIPGVYGRLASDPIRGALQQGIEAVAGVDVVGSGAAASNGFRFGSARRDRSRGTARLGVRVPGRGKLLLRRSEAVSHAAVYPTEAGTVRLPVRALGKAKRRLNRTGTARVRARVTYKPIGGNPHTKSTLVRLAKRR